MRVLVPALFALACAGCGGAGNTAPLAEGGGDAGAPPSPSPAPGPSSTPSPSATPIPGLTVDPSVSARVVVGGLGTLDDIAVAPDGTVYIGDERDGKLSAWSPATGKVTLISGALSHPEGIVALDGLLVVCEQGKNQLSRVDPSDGSVTLLRALSNPTGKLGVDGLAFDPIHPSIVVPDSPNGTLLRVSLDGRTATPIPVTSASQPPFMRPTGAFVRADGTLFIADEDGGDIVLRRTDGSLQALLIGLNAPDDVLGDDRGNVYVNSVGDGVLHRLQGTTHEKLITGLDAPHGLAFDLDGNLLVTDVGGGGRLIKVFVH
jgi:streptogramin lyase